MPKNGKGWADGQVLGLGDFDHSCILCTIAAVMQPAGFTHAALLPAHASHYCWIQGHAVNHCYPVDAPSSVLMCCALCRRTSFLAVGKATAVA